MLELSELKAAWHIEKIGDLKRGKDVVPSHVQIILSDLCNQDCHFCAYRMEGGFSTEKFGVDGNKNPNRRIPTEKVFEILSDCARLGVEAIEFTGGGEPTVHPDWEKIIAYAQSLGLSTGLVTNAVRLKDCPSVDGLTWLRVSLDAGKKETYQRIRKSLAWDKVMKNLDMLGKKKGPLIGVGFVLTRENYKELEDCAKIVKGFGIPYIRVSAMFSTGGADYYDGLIDEINAQRILAKNLENDNFKVVDFFDDRVLDLKKESPDYSFCGYQQFVLYIGGDQKVYTCCTNAYTTAGEIGDLSNMSFASWLKSHRRYEFDARKCHHCQFNNKNKIIDYLINPSPAHIGFV